MKQGKDRWDNFANWKPTTRLERVNTYLLPRAVQKVIDSWLEQGDHYAKTRWTPVRNACRDLCDLANQADGLEHLRDQLLESPRMMVLVEANRAFHLVRRGVATQGCDHLVPTEPLALARFVFQNHCRMMGADEDPC